MYRQGNIFVNVRMLDSPSLTKVFAHELGHYVLGRWRTLKARFPEPR